MKLTPDSADDRSDEDSRVPRYTQSHAIARLGGSPSAPTVRSYIHAGLIHPFSDSQGRFLFSDRDIDNIRKIHEARAKRRGCPIRRVTSTYTG